MTRTTPCVSSAGPAWWNVAEGSKSRSRVEVKAASGRVERRAYGREKRRSLGVERAMIAEERTVRRDESFRNQRQAGRGVRWNKHQVSGRAHYMRLIQDKSLKGGGSQFFFLHRSELHHLKTLSANLVDRARKRASTGVHVQSRWAGSDRCLGSLRWSRYRPLEAGCHG